jgi:hypothetical protein
MKCYIRLLRLCAALSLVSGCAVQGRPFEKAGIPSGSAIVYVYRPYRYEGSLLRPPVTCGEDMARIGPGGYHAFVVPAGQTVDCGVQGGETSDLVQIDGDSHVYYLKEEIGWGVLTGHPHLNPVDADRANSEIQHCCVLEQQPAS